MIGNTIKDIAIEINAQIIDEFPVQYIRVDFISIIEYVQTPDKLYIPTRYPNGLPEITPMEAFSEKDFQIAYGAAQILLKRIRNLV